VRPSGARYRQSLPFREVRKPRSKCQPLSIPHSGLHSVAMFRMLCCHCPTQHSATPTTTARLHCFRSSHPHPSAHSARAVNHLLFGLSGDELSSELGCGDTDGKYDNTVVIVLPNSVRMQRTPRPTCMHSDSSRGHALLWPLSTQSHDCSIDTCSCGHCRRNHMIVASTRAPVATVDAIT
jgi:hypothetical protein